MESFLEENKFYVPKIEEFYVGFEFEWFGSKGKVGSLRSNAIESWDKVIIKDKQQLSDICISNYIIRVKYLDKEDIESLGFEKIRDGEYQIESKPRYATWVLKVRDDKLRIRFYHPDDSQGENWFYGIIKNKSELKKLLQQLGIRFKNNKE